jgi:hypothetical protein
MAPDPGFSKVLKMVPKCPLDGQTRPALKSFTGCLCNCKAQHVTAFFECNDGGRGEDGPSGRCGDTTLRIPGVTSEIDLVKFDEKNEQKNQQYEEK